MRVLVIAPHADDEVLGVGGTMARHADEGDEVVVAVMTGHGDEGPHPIAPKERWDEVRAEARHAHAVLGVTKTVFGEIPAVLVADQPLWKLNAAVEQVLHDIAPDVLYIPFPLDLHQDHRSLAHACSVCWRPNNEVGRGIREIYAYETVSETHWGFPYLEAAFTPNQWVNIERQWERKRAALECYTSQMHPFPAARSIEAVESLSRWRGSQMGLPAAEAFVTIRRIF